MPSFSNAQPGAVPQVLWNTVHPSGSIVWEKLFGVKCRLFFIYSYSPAVSLLSSTSGTPNARAVTTFVKSSHVGPSPPVVIIMSARPFAVSMHWARRSGLSPTTV